jgi:hypothetical protein
MEPPIAFDRDGWVRVGRAAVVVSAILWLAMAAILLLAPASDQCPGWHVKGHSLWEALWLWGAPVNAFGCFIAVRRHWFIRRTIESDSSGIPATHFFVRLCVMNSVAGQFPLALLLTTCF